MRLILLLCVLLASSSRGASAASSQPDILLVMPDQMRGDCLSARGHPVVRTPHLDSLAKEGAMFRRAYTTCPSCIPARYSLLTGLYPATSGVVGFKGKLITQPTLPKLLGDASYMPVLVGRTMHQVPEEEPYGFQTRIRGSTYLSGDDYDSFLKQAAPGNEGIRQLVQKLGVSFNGWEAKPWPLDEELHPNAWVVNQARKTLQDASTNKPLFVTASFFSPHPPLFPPKRYFDYYGKQKLPAPAHGDWVKWDELTTKGDNQGHRVLLEGETLRATQAGYFGLVEMLDDQTALLVADFKERSRKAHRPWLVVFTTDHGEMLGDHGFFRKCEPYEGSANIPFIIAASPELGFRKGVVSDQLVCLEDVLPTLLAVAGAKCPQPMDGINLVPLLRGEAKTTRPWLHTEHAVCYSKEQAFHALTDGHFKYIWRPLDGSEQLFDLNADPHEEHDLAKVNSQKDEVKIWRGQMIARLVNRPEGFTDGTRLIAGRPYPPLQSR